MRAHPQDYIPELNRQISMFTDPNNPFNLLDPDYPGVEWEQGQKVEAWVEAKQKLAVWPPAEELGWNDELYQSAKAHLNDMVETGKWQKYGSDGTPPADEIREYYHGTDDVFRAHRADVQRFGYDPILLAVIMGVDSENPDNHEMRKMLFNETEIGVACGQHPTRGFCCVFDFGIPVSATV